MNKRKMLNKALTENFRATHSGQLENKNLEDVKKGELIYVTNGMYDVCIGEYLGDYHQVTINSGAPGKRYQEYEFEVRVVLPLDDRYKEGSLTNGFASYPGGSVSVFTGSLENESLKEGGEMKKSLKERENPRYEICVYMNSAAAERRPLEPDDADDLEKYELGNDEEFFETLAEYDIYSDDDDIEEIQERLENQDYGDGAPVVYKVIYRDKVIFDDSAYFESLFDDMEDYDDEEDYDEEDEDAEEELTEEEEVEKEVEKQMQRLNDPNHNYTSAYNGHTNRQEASLYKQAYEKYGWKAFVLYHPSLQYYPYQTIAFKDPEATEADIPPQFRDGEIIEEKYDESLKENYFDTYSGWRGSFGRPDPWNDEPDEPYVIVLNDEHKSEIDCYSVEDAIDTANRENVDIIELRPNPYSSKVIKRYSRNANGTFETLLKEVAISLAKSGLTGADIADNLMANYKADKDTACELGKDAYSYVRYELGYFDESLKEASYGGAFDIEDNQFFTRDDLDELMDDINDRCRTQFPERGMEAIEAYMSEDGKTLEVVMEDADYGEESVFIPVDMRSIRKPSDLLKYSNRVIKEFIRQADNFNAYYDHVNSFYGEQLDEALGEGPADFIVPVYTVDEEVELKDKLAEVEVTLGELYDEYGKDRIDYLLKRANYASYVREHRLGYALEHLISDLAIKKFREANPEYAHEILSNDRPVILNGNLVDSGVEELGKVLGKKLLPHLGEAWEDDWYFGKEEADKYKDLILDNLSGKKISKSRDLAYDEGGIAYEANKLGLDLFDLLHALEGGCYQGWVKEIDDSTYQVMPSGYSDQDNLALYGEGLNEDLGEETIKIGDKTFFLSSRYTYKDGTMLYHSQGYPEGRPEKRRPYRVSPKYNMYVDSFRGQAYPTSTVYIADKESGEVWEGKVDLYMGARDDYAKIVEWMRNGGHLDPEPKSQIDFNPLSDDNKPGSLL